MMESKAMITVNNIVTRSTSRAATAREATAREATAREATATEAAATKAAAERIGFGFFVTVGFVQRLMLLEVKQIFAALKWISDHMQVSPGMAQFQSRFFRLENDSKRVCMAYIDGLIELTSAEEFLRALQDFMITQPNGLV